MPARIRLARHGRKKLSYYHIVVADARAPRDGRIIERIGSYNPNTNPATIDLDFDKALNWLHNGAQPSDTCRAILSYKGVLYKDHLLRGVKKGALTVEEADAKFIKWKTEKESKIQAKRDSLLNETVKDLDKRLKAETKIREVRAQELAKKNSDLAKALGIEVEAKVMRAKETEKTEEPATEVENAELQEKPVDQEPQE